MDGFVVPGAAYEAWVVIVLGECRTGMSRLVGAAFVLSVVAFGSSSCASAAAPPKHPDPPPATRAPLAARAESAPPGTSVLAGAPDTLAAGAARALFSSAPVVVVADARHSTAVSAAALQAGLAHAPLLLATGARVGGATRTEIGSLHPRTVLAVGVARKALAAQLPGTRVVTRHGHDPRANPAAIRALSAARPQRVIALGAGFRPVRRLRARLAVAETGVQLPGGGEVLFPMRRLVALYGHPGTPALGVLGEQDLPASIARAKKTAARYRRLSKTPVIPAFEIIATVAEGSPGPDGSYSYQTPLAALLPWVRRASRAGMYVVLDLQAGRASLLTQAKEYEPILALPNVGLALDPEWKLQPGQRPLRQIGSVTAREVNSVSNWLAGITARHHLPQKLFVLHQFQLSMIGNENRIDTRHDDLAIVIHMDGQGTPTDKQQTWQAVTGAAPRHVFFGWKNFYVKDHPMLSPRQTMARIPKPVMISYQ